MVTVVSVGVSSIVGGLGAEIMTVSAVSKVPFATTSGGSDLPKGLATVGSTTGPVELSICMH